MRRWRWKQWPARGVGLDRDRLNDDPYPHPDPANPADPDTDPHPDPPDPDTPPDADPDTAAGACAGRRSDYCRGGMRLAPGLAVSGRYPRLSRRCGLLTRAGANRHVVSVNNYSTAPVFDVVVDFVVHYVDRGAGGPRR